MRMLLVLGEDALRNACSDYYDVRGCDVDTAGSPAEAEPLLRFRDYDLVLADLPAAEPARGEVLRLLGQVRRSKTTVRVLLTTDQAGVERVDDSLFILTKPQPLDAILSLGAAHALAR